MKEIINTALVTFQYTTGTETVTKATATQSVTAINDHPPSPSLCLAATTACAQFCQPFWLVCAVNNPSCHAQKFGLIADFNAPFDAMPEIFIDGAPLYGDISKGVSLIARPLGVTVVHFCVVFSRRGSLCTPCFPNFCGNTLCAQGAVRGCFFCKNAPIYVFSNAVSIPLVPFCGCC